MKKVYAKRLKEYEAPSEFETEKILEAMKRSKKRRKPTSVALDEEIIEDLKKLADKKNIPYQVLMRMFIINGLKKMKKAA